MNDDLTGGQERWEEWVRSRMFERRTVMVSGPLGHEAASQTAAELMTLDASGDDPVLLYVDSSGGPFEAALGLMDVIDLLGVPVHVNCVGRAEGSAVGVVAVGHRRVAAPHARFRLCDPPAEARGRAGDLARWAEDHARGVDQFCRRVATAARKPVDEVAAVVRSGCYLDADEARRFGLVDEIAASAAGVRLLHPRTVGFRPDR